MLDNQVIYVKNKCFHFIHISDSLYHRSSQTIFLMITYFVHVAGSLYHRSSQTIISVITYFVHVPGSLYHRSSQTIFSVITYFVHVPGSLYHRSSQTIFSVITYFVHVAGSLYHHCSGHPHHQLSAGCQLCLRCRGDHPQQLPLHGPNIRPKGETISSSAEWKIFGLVLKILRIKFFLRGIFEIYNYIMWEID